MAKRTPQTFEKLQRERRKQRKRQEKLEQRLERNADKREAKELGIDPSQLADYHRERGDEERRREGEDEG